MEVVDKFEMRERGKNYRLRGNSIGILCFETYYGEMSWKKWRSGGWGRGEEIMEKEKQ